MNTPFGEPEKLALLQADILLLPNSLIIKETPNPSASLRATHQLELDMKYALADVKVLVTQGKLLDFTILAHPPSPLPISAMLDHIVIEESTSLVNLVKMIIKALQKHHSSLLEGTLMEHVPGDLARLTEMYPEMRYELVYVEDQLTVVLRFKPDEEISLASVNNLLKAEKLVNTADHCFNIKMEFDPEGKFKIEGFQVQWSLDLAAMLPELADARLPVLKVRNTLLEFIMTTRDALGRLLVVATTAWEERSKVMLQLVNVFAGLKEVAVTLDSDTMTAIDLIFRTRSRSHVYTVTLYTGNKRGAGKIEYKALTLEDGKVLFMEPAEFKASDLKEGDASLGQALLKAIRERVAGDELKKKVLSSVGIEADGGKVALVAKELAGKNLEEVIAAGTEKLVPSGGGAAAAATPAAGGAAHAAAAPLPQEESEEEDDDEGF